MVKFLGALAFNFTALFYIITILLEPSVLVLILLLLLLILRILNAGHLAERDKLADPKLNICVYSVAGRPPNQPFNPHPSPSSHSVG